MGVTSATSSATRRTRARMPSERATRRLTLRLRIDALEVLHHRLPLLGRQPAQLVPRRLRILEGGAPRRIRLRRFRDLRIRSRLGLALSRVLALVFLQRESRIEQAVEELLLPVE